jgi:hypothetical protein
MTARPLTVIPPKYTAVPITQPDKIILMYKRFFLIFKKKFKKIIISKTVLNGMSSFGDLGRFFETA